MFYGCERASERVKKLYEAFQKAWSVETCAPRWREVWSSANNTVGQCSITAFLVQDILGGKVLGIPLEDGTYHCFNEADGAVFDLTSEQFGGRQLDYSAPVEQDRSEHFENADKYARYLLLKERLEAALDTDGANNGSSRVFFFSATGNSLFAAKRIAEKLGTKAEYLCKYDGGKVDAERVVIVSPVYAMGLPVPTVEFIKKLKTKAECTLVLTYGGALMGAKSAACAEAREAGLNVKAVYSIKSVENFTVFFTVPKFYMNRVLKRMPQRADAVAERILAGEAAVPKLRGGRRDSVKMRESWHEMGAKLHSTDACVRCGKCVNVCPAQNIELSQTGVVFKNNCVACLGCYHRCPQKAIRFGKYKKKFRYFCPLSDEKEIRN